MSSHGYGAAFRSPPLAAVRIRPWLNNEDPSLESIRVATHSSSASAAVEVRTQGRCWAYPSHFVFSPEHPQAWVYKELLTKIIGEAIASGRGGSILVCGPPGSGKSHTTLGYGADPGLIPLATLDIFRSVSGGNGKLKVWCSYFEVLSDELIDLLEPLPDPKDVGSQERSREIPPVEFVELRGASAHICGLTECYVESIQEVQKLVDYGNKRRSAMEKLCAVHGRSHTVFTFHLAWEQDENGLDAAPPQRRSRISFIDCASAHGFKDPSLMGLAEALKDMALGGPRVRGLGKTFFRRSLLTQLLEDALMGKEQLVLLTTLSPGSPESEACEYLDLVHSVMEASRAGVAVAGPLPHDKGSHRESFAMLQLEMEALQKYVSPDERYSEDGEFKAARLVALQRVLTERAARMAPVQEQVAASLALRKAQVHSLALWGFASEEDVAMAPCLLLRLHGDPMITGSLAYVISGSRVMGSDSEIFLQGLGIAGEHCQLTEHSGGLWLTNLCHKRNRLFVNGKSMNATTTEPLRHGDRIQLGWAVELLVVDTERPFDLSMEVQADLWTRPLDILIEEANELLSALGQVQTAEHYKYFEAVDPPVEEGQEDEDLVRLRKKSEAAEEAVTFWPVGDLRKEVKRMQELYNAPVALRHAKEMKDVPKDGRSRSIVLQPHFAQAPNVNSASAIPSQCLVQPPLPKGKAASNTPASAIPSECLVQQPAVKEGFRQPRTANTSSSTIPLEAMDDVGPVTNDVGQENSPGRSSCATTPMVQPPAPKQKVEVESAVQKEEAIAVSLRRAHQLSQCIGDTVSALQETVAELRRSSSGSFSMPEAFERLQLDNQEMKQRLNRLETHLERQAELSVRSSMAKDPNSQRSSAAVPSEPSTVPSQRVVIQRIPFINEAAERFRSGPSVAGPGPAPPAVRALHLSGRATSPMPRPEVTRVTEPVATRSAFLRGSPMAQSPSRRTIASYRVHLEAVPKQAALRHALDVSNKMPLVQRSQRSTLMNFRGWNQAPYLTTNFRTL